MAKRRAIDELDDAVDALMAEPRAPSPHMNPRLVALLRIAADLRDLPSEAFKARLRAELLSEVRAGGAPPSAGRPLVTEEDIRARLEELAGEPGMVAHDLRAALGDLPEMTMRFLASLNRCTLGVTRFSEPPHRERHPGGRERARPREGEADVTPLTDGGPARGTVRARSVFVWPRGLWHRQLPRPAVTMFFGTPTENEEVSWAEDPRREG